jgi:hypothetical protein
VEESGESEVPKRLLAGISIFSTLRAEEKEDGLTNRVLANIRRLFLLQH